MEGRHYLTVNVASLKVVGMYPRNKNDTFISILLYNIWTLFVIITQAYVAYFSMAEVYHTKKNLINSSINILNSGKVVEKICEFNFNKYVL